MEGSMMLADMNVLIVEDEALIALDIAMTVEDGGATVVGPVGDVASALDRSDAADLAILDVDLCGEPVFPVADRLQANGVPFIFHTGRHDISVLRLRYGDAVEIVEKPSTPDYLVSRLADLLRAA
jgi:DNA-binding response OmpR family regulator